ncbi:hypothetical protein KIH27_03985 [Mycobacterium sp. M1]|uniref:Uncharacterized protein n=1 Tax=Mycolicibacter acidiphilus TaxID=2835306 RepID=A0ABS5REN0_9MYCO|nr:hypothetical protein [Mycolicibacter acidiphilus]MBS9532745.1 hypothetical protein [Mycolicibacter acidiphilus]
MSRIKSFLTATAGVAAGLFLGALGASAAAHADTAPIAPGLPGVFEQVVASSATIPQQLLQSTSSALTGSALNPAAPATQGPLATVTLNTPQTTSALGSGTPASGLSGLPGSLGSMLPFPLPNFGGAAPAAAPTMVSPVAALPGSLLAPVAMSPVAMDPVSMVAIPGLP